MNTTALPSSTGLSLDARQRAMLLEMGVQLWWPQAPGPDAAATPEGRAAAAPASQPPQTAAPAPTAPTANTRPQPSAAAVRPAPPAPPTNSPRSSYAPTAVLSPPQALYAPASPEHSPLGAGPAWLLVAESLPEHSRPSEQARKLLDNMLRALGLQHNPRVFLCSLSSAAGMAASGQSTISDTLAQTLAQLQPAVVLLMGRAAARHALGRSDPLEQLRALDASLCGIPAVVTYDAPLLLRSPARKPAAWEDLCRARALAMRQTASKA